MRQPTSIKPIRFQPQGFTLIEIVIGIVALGIALSLLSVLLFPQAKRSAEPFMQMRAAELGIALMNEVSSKSFDHNSHHSGGVVRCGETNAPACSSVLGRDGSETRDSFNDVDDYHGLNDMTNSLNHNLSTRYPGFSYHIDVCYSSKKGDCLAANPPSAYKRIQITITTPLGENFTFSGIRGNY